MSDKPTDPEKSESSPAGTAGESSMHQEAYARNGRGEGQTGKSQSGSAPKGSDAAGPHERNQFGAGLGQPPATHIEIPPINPSRN
ncbi:hypothetical protein BH10CYA1_BH10CYA1_53330 [soil metagenome]